MQLLNTPEYLVYPCWRGRSHGRTQTGRDGDFLAKCHCNWMQLVCKFNPRPFSVFRHLRQFRGGLVRPPWRSAPDGRRASRKKTVDASRWDLAIAHIVFCARSTFDLVRSGQRSNSRGKWHFLALHAHSGVRCVVSIWNLHQRLTRSILNKIVRCYCIPLQHAAYIVLLSITASSSLAVIAVTVKIQIGPMTMIGQGVGEEVVWRRFYQQWTTDSDSALQETPLSICRLVIGHCEVNRGQWPQVTLDDLETHVMQDQGSQLVMYWHQSHQLCSGVPTYRAFRACPAPLDLGRPCWIRKGTLKTYRYVCIYGAPSIRMRPSA